MNTSYRRLRPGFLTSVAVGAMAMTSGVAAQPTAVEELVLYGIDADTHELLRYTFDTDEFIRIGTVVDQNGYVIDHPECLTYIPSGPNRGFYSIPSGKDNTGGPEDTLMKINGMDASAWAFPDPIGYSKYRGMVSVQDQVTGVWSILAWARDPTTCIMEIDPGTGLGTPGMTLANDYEGLAWHPGPGKKLFAITADALWVIDLDAETEAFVGDQSAWDRIESLEMAFGDFGPAVDMSAYGVDSTWTQDGALFAFSDGKDAMLVLNPTAGGFEQYACSFDTVDCEGLVFVTQMSDPYGKILVDARD